jgi:hypothetical protein
MAKESVGDHDSQGLIPMGDALTVSEWRGKNSIPGMVRAFPEKNFRRCGKWESRRKGFRIPARAARCQ